MLRGCDPDEYETSEREVTAAQGMPSGNVAARCGMFELSGGEVTVRGLTFEYSRLGLLLGCCHTEPRFRPTPGGYTIERNVFRNSLNGIRPWTTEPSVIRENEFVNTFHAISGVGSHLHVLDNEISVPDPSQVPGIGHPSFAIALGPLPGRAANALGLEDNGVGNVIAGNQIEGHPDGILISVFPGTTFRGNVIRDNTIRVSRVPIPPSGPRPWIVDVTAEADSTIVGIPITLYARPGFPGAEADDQEDGWFEDNLIEGNRILGAEGVAIALQRGRGNRIVGNAIRDVVWRDPFPGNTVVSSSELWEAANGSGIWISPDSEDNEVAENTFEDVAGTGVFLGADGGATTGYTFPSCGLSVEGPHTTGEIRSVHVTMRDGVRIALDVVLPDPLPQAGVPTILQMTRYWRSEEGRPPGERERFFTSHGYALVVGDARGTGASFGRWPHHRSEAETRDFVEVIDWIVEQPWSDGKVVGLGSSYAANTADWMSVRGHPALKAVVSRFPDFDPYADLYFPGGVPNAFMGREWGTEVKEMDLNVKRSYEDGPRGVRPVDADSAGRLLARAIEERRDIPSVWEGLRTVTYRDDAPEGWDGASVDDWGTQDRTDAIERWGGPIQSWASWMDAGTANGVLHRLMTLENPQQAFIGAWSHGGWQDADPFRPPDAEARPPAPLQFAEALCFLQRQLGDGAASEREPEPRLVYYTMGEGRWKTTDEWPPAGVESQPLYLATGSRLSPSLPSAESTDEYVVDTTATTGTTNRWATNATGGDVVYADRAAEAPKLLTYTSDPLPDVLEITGQPVAHLSVTSTHEDGAFFVYLEAVAPDGAVVYLTEGMLRALHRKVSIDEPPYRVLGPYRTFERADAGPLVPGRVASLAFELMPTSVLVPEGWRLRVSVAGADADTFGRVPEEGVPELEVHLGGVHASRVDLPVVPRGM